MNIQEYINKLIEKHDLSRDEAFDLMKEILAGNVTAVRLSLILTALRMKGESINEIVGFILAMRKYMVTVKTKGIVIDTCGTGGDGKGTFNISTAVALVVAGAGVKVAKHGNKAASSQCGSADVLHKLGVNIILTSQQAARCFEEAGIVFLFALQFHPAMKHVAPVRQELKIRSVFNFLGPFANPAGVKRQIIGVPNIVLAEKLAQVAAYLDYEHVMIVSSEEGLDEISIGAKSTIFSVKGNHISTFVIDPHTYGLSGRIDEIGGGIAAANAPIIMDILHGVQGPGSDIVLLNSAAALMVAGKVKNINDGIELARISIQSGKAKEKLQKLIEVSNSFI